MPKKPNRKELQNYIGAGNGDKSGEYTFDNGGGSSTKNDDDPIAKLNKDFPIVDIPDEDTGDGIKITEKPKEDKPEDEKPLPSDVKGKVKEYIKRHSDFSKNDINNINRIVEKGSDECNKLIGDAYEEGNYSFEKLRSKKQTSAFCPTQGKIKLNSNALSGNYDCKEDGETFYHENGHLLDALKGYGNEYSMTFVSDKYGKTLNDMIQEEDKSFVENHMYDKLKEEEEAYKRSLMPKKTGLSQEEIKEYYNAEDKIAQINKKLTSDFDVKREELLRKKESGEMSSDAVDTEWNKYIGDYHAKADAEINKYKNIQSKNKSKIIYGEMDAESDIFKVFGAVEDVVNGAYDGYMRTKSFHPDWYWTIKGNKGREFFAENFASIALNNKTKEVMAKYFPKSHEIVQEIIRSMKNG